MSSECGNDRQGRQEVWWGESVSANIHTERVTIDLIAYDGTKRPGLEMSLKSARELYDHLGSVLKELDSRYIRGFLSEVQQSVDLIEEGTE